MIHYKYDLAFDGTELGHIKIKTPEKIFITDFNDDSVKEFQENFSNIDDD